VLPRVKPSQTLITKSRLSIVAFGKASYTTGSTILRQAGHQSR
jgi:hypothetical protein